MGKNRIQYFDTPILNDFLKNVELDSKIKKKAVFDRNFILYYQPQTTRGNQKLRGMEALIRWKDGDGKMISPAKFIPIAEKNGTIIPIGNWVLEQSIRTFPNGGTGTAFRLYCLSISPHCSTRRKTSWIRCYILSANMMCLRRRSNWRSQRAY